MCVCEYNCVVCVCEYNCVVCVCEYNCVVTGKSTCVITSTCRMHWCLWLDTIQIIGYKYSMPFFNSNAVK